MADVEFLEINKTYDDGTRALTDLNLHVNDGELMVLVGPSGCGKSTALRILAGLDPQSSGDIFIDGESQEQKPPQQRNVAMVFQNYALYPHMSVERNLTFPLKMQKLPRKEIKRRVMEAAQLLELDDLLSRKPKQLSGGQRQRVAMGRAIVRHPTVFLMDEPLSNLDAKLRVQIRAEIAALQRRMATTTLYVTHDQVEAMTLGDRVAVLNRGELQQVDTPQQLYDHPANTFVAAFIGSPGMNILPSQLRRSSNGFEAAIGDQWLNVGAGALGKTQTLLQHIDQPIQLGLRPEAFHLQSPDENGSAVTVAISAIEALGHEHLLYFTLAGKTAVARLQGKAEISLGEKIALHLETEKLYFFDDTGRSIY